MENSNVCSTTRPLSGRSSRRTFVRKLRRLTKKLPIMEPIEHLLQTFVRTGVTWRGIEHMFESVAAANFMGAASSCNFLQILAAANKLELRTRANSHINQIQAAVKAGEAAGSPIKSNKCSNGGCIDLKIPQIKPN